MHQLSETLERNVIDRSEHLNELATALAKAQAQIATAKRDAANPFFKSSYADLASVWEACRAQLTQNGLSVVQFPGVTADGAATLDTMLLHSSGQWLSSRASAPLGKQDAQGVGSAITYLRRYALAAVASVSPADDDGNAAAGRGGAGSPSKKSGVASKGTLTPMPPAPTEPLTEKPRAIVAAQAEDPLAPGETLFRRKPLKDYASTELVAIRNLAEKKGTDEWLQMAEKINEVLASRQGE